MRQKKSKLFLYILLLLVFAVLFLAMKDLDIETKKVEEPIAVETLVSK